MARLFKGILAVCQQVALRVARVLRGIASGLAEWAGMHKRIEIVVRNPGFERTENALGAYNLDFEDQRAFDAALAAITGKLSMYGPLPNCLVMQNEKGEQVGFNPEYYVSHRVGDIDDWQSTKWLLPQEGAKPGPDS
jgi:hypothetical protein